MSTENYREILNGGPQRERGFFWCKQIGCCWKIVIGERRSEEAKQAHYGSLRALLTLRCRRPVAISNYLARVKSKTCNLQRIFQKKTTRQVCFLFHLKKKRNQLSRKSTFFCKGTMNIKKNIFFKCKLYLSISFCCSKLLNRALIDLHAHWLCIFSPFPLWFRKTYFDLFGEASGLCKPQLSPVGRQRTSDLWRGLPPPTN